jgi:aminoglycoside phosphotransferase (APT) family kinase protein
MAALHARFWGFRDTSGLTTPIQRYGFAHPSHSVHERDGVPGLFPGGWAALERLAPEAAELGLALAADATPLARAMADGPRTLVHGDWKFGNLGTQPDGRTVLLDWGWPGEAGPAVDLAWYLAVNCDRLPESKEDSIETYRTALERRGIATAPWWQRHLEFALLGGFLQLAWSKTSDPTELAWWTERALATRL